MFINKSYIVLSMSQEQLKLPSFIDYTYTTWHFWTIVGLWSFFTIDYEFLSIGEFTGTLVGAAFTLSIFYFLSYLLTKSTFKRLRK